MRPGHLVHALLFQLGWLACVAGGNRWAVAAGAALLPLHYLWFGRSLREWALIGAFAAIGLGMDLGWQRLGLLQFAGAGALGVPPWLVVLWLIFTGTPFHAFAFLQRHLGLAALCGALAAPLSYVAGIALGAATSPHPAWQVAVAMAPAWALLLPLFAYLARFAREPAPRVRERGAA